MPLTGSSMLAIARQTFSRARLAPTAEGTGTVGAGPRNSRIWKHEEETKKTTTCELNHVEIMKYRQRNNI